MAAPPSETYDLCVIGCGPGGFAAAMRALDLGKRVCVIEGAEIGGAGVQWGALASKTMWELAKDLAIAAQAERGFRASGLTVDYQAVRDSVLQAVREKQYQMLSQLEAFSPRRWPGPGSVTLKRGWGAFEGPRAVGVTYADGRRETVSAEFVVVATGSKPRPFPGVTTDGARVVDFRLAYPRAAFDEQSMLWDLNYFKYHFLKLAHVPFNEQRLEDDFHRLIAHLLSADTGYFLYRDFQSRNILLRDGAPWFVDYQGGRRGAAQYDVASLLYDAKADVPEEVRERLLEGYLAGFTRLAGTDRSRFLETYRGHVLVRIVQAMGAYGYRGFFERKVRFLESVPYAARNVAGLLRAGLPVRLPELEAVLRRVVAEWAGRPSPVEPPRGLTVHVTSFSYRDGAPPDETGHGGGHVFDCRWLPNPGRLAEFSGLTGRDPPVARFLEAIPETEEFWRHVVALVDAHVANFRERNFTDLSVAFGCTGGQHRSVYFAERLAAHVRERHPGVTVHLRHTARERWALRASPEAAAASPGTEPWKG